MSTDRIDIDLMLATQLVVEQFPQWANLPILTVKPGGWDNKTFRLGHNMSLRFPSAERYAGQVAKEHQWLPRLAPHLPLPIPTPLAMGQAAQGYPWHWSVYQWLAGETATHHGIDDVNQLALDLAQFLKALQRIDPMGGPLPGPHNFFRGGSLLTYDAETRSAIAKLQHTIDTDIVTEIWEIALESTWQGSPVWLHGDIHQTNLLVHQQQLHAVIDFGCLGAGDPACDYAIAWTFFSDESRPAFQSAAVDDATWARSRGWALWKSLIKWVEALDTKASTTVTPQTIHKLIDDYYRDTQQTKNI